MPNQHANFEGSNVLCFPPVKRERIRRSKSMDAAGNLSLLLLYRDNEPIPENVRRIDQPHWPVRSLPTQTPALFLAAMVYEHLGTRKRQAIQRISRQLAFDGNRAAAEVLNLLRLSSQVHRTEKGR